MTRLAAIAAIALTSCGESLSIRIPYPEGARPGTEILAVKTLGSACAVGKRCTSIYVNALDGSDIHTRIPIGEGVEVELSALIFDREVESLSLEVGQQAITDPARALRLPIADRFCSMRLRGSQADADWTCTSSVPSEHDLSQMFPLERSVPPCFQIDKTRIASIEDVVGGPAEAAFAGVRRRVVVIGEDVIVGTCPFNAHTQRCPIDRSSTLVILNRGFDTVTQETEASPALRGLVVGDSGRNFLAVSRAGVLESYTHEGQLQFTQGTAWSVIDLVRGPEGGLGVLATDRIAMHRAVDLSPVWSVRTSTALTLHDIVFHGSSFVASGDDRLLSVDMDGRSMRLRSIEGAGASGFAIGQILEHPASGRVLAALSRGPGLVVALADLDGPGGTIANLGVARLASDRFREFAGAVSWSLAAWPHDSRRYVAVAFTAADPSQTSYLAVLDPTTMSFVSVPEVLGAGPIDRIETDGLGQLWAYLPRQGEIALIREADLRCVDETNRR
jgi:hypothetical protein